MLIPWIPPSQITFWSIQQPPSRSSIPLPSSPNYHNKCTNSALQLDIHQWLECKFSILIIWSHSHSKCPAQKDYSIPIPAWWHTFHQHSKIVTHGAHILVSLVQWSSVNRCIKYGWMYENFKLQMAGIVKQEWQKYVESDWPALFEKRYHLKLHPLVFSAIASDSGISA